MNKILNITFFFIVTSSKVEPVVGWIDNWFGASALLTTISKGLNRVILSDSENSLDLIPVDYVSNLTIVAAARCEWYMYLCYIK